MGRRKRRRRKASAAPSPFASPCQHGGVQSTATCLQHPGHLAGDVLRGEGWPKKQPKNPHRGQAGVKAAAGAAERSVGKHTKPKAAAGGAEDPIALLPWGSPRAAAVLMLAAGFPVKGPGICWGMGRWHSSCLHGEQHRKLWVSPGPSTLPPCYPRGLEHPARCHGTAQPWRGGSSHQKGEARPWKMSSSLLINLNKPELKFLSQAGVSPLGEACSTLQ